MGFIKHGFHENVLSDIVTYAEKNLQSKVEVFSHF